MIVATVIGLAVLPLIVLRGRTLWAYFGTDAATWLLAWILHRRLPSFDPYLGFVVIAVLKLTTLCVFVAVGRRVRWSANRAALLAAIVYGLTIPAMLRTPIDGDEPYYLLQTVSLVQDFDLDLANQYAAKAGAVWGRDDLVPLQGDPVGKDGQRYSRQEPFLPVLMIPGYLLAGLYGAIATIALFGVLLVRTTVRWMEDEGVPDDAVRAVFPFFAFAPPVLFFATRIWPEVPAAFFFVEALRALRNRRPRRWVPALAGLVLLKLRFGLVALGLLASAWRERGAKRRSTMVNVLIIALLLLPLLIAAAISGNFTNVHTLNELIPTSPLRYAVGLGGLLTDGMSGIAFQAPFYLLALIALLRWKRTPTGFRTGMLASLLYLFYLFPRGEWFGGWAPSLRYLVFLMPVLALGIASIWRRIPRSAVALAAAWTVALVIHGVAYPWRLFHEFTGENAVGEWLSGHFHTDFSRLFPSFVRMNGAAWWGFAIVVFAAVWGAGAAWVAERRSQSEELHPARAPLLIALAAVLITAGYRWGLQPGARVEFEDTHVTRHGGKIYPDPYTLMRATYRGGWILEEGQSLSFCARGGTHTLHLITGLGATFELDGHAYTVRPDLRYQTVRVTTQHQRVTLRCLSGAINVDRMDHE